MVNPLGIFISLILSAAPVILQDSSVKFSFHANRDNEVFLQGEAGANYGYHQGSSVNIFPFNLNLRENRTETFGWESTAASDSTAASYTTAASNTTGASYTTAASDPTAAPKSRAPQPPAEAGGEAITLPTTSTKPFALPSHSASPPTTLTTASDRVKLSPASAENGHDTSNQEGAYSGDRNNAEDGRSLKNDDGYPTLNQVSVQDLKNGKRCVEKVELVDSYEESLVVTCDHTYSKQCHTTYVTTYSPTQVEDCEENYIKDCFIVYETIAFKEPVKICSRPLLKDCEVEGEEICRTEYQSECWTARRTKIVEEDKANCREELLQDCKEIIEGYTTSNRCESIPRVKCHVSKEENVKVKPETLCTKEPVELCAPAGCGFKPGPEECRQEIRTIIQDKPVEECSLQPRRSCKFVTKLVPQLIPQEDCVDIPKEVCRTARERGGKVKKPVLKKWCYHPSSESGLD